MEKFRYGIILIFLFFLTQFVIHPANASTEAAGKSAILSQGGNQEKENIVLDTRSIILERFLSRYDETLASSAASFIEAADTYKLDWKLIPAISGVESTFGQQIPFKCNNAWGFGIYGDHMQCFDSYRSAIFTIAKALREQYIDKWGATDVYSIGKFYAASPTWAERVVYFMGKIDTFASQTENQPLPISL